MVGNLIGPTVQFPVRQLPIFGYRGHGVSSVHRLGLKQLMGAGVFREI